MPTVVRPIETGREPEPVCFFQPRSYGIALGFSQTCLDLSCYIAFLVVVIRSVFSCQKRLLSFFRPTYIYTY
jgi:hypothetical protein